MKVLIVEDQKRLAQLLKRRLVERAYTVTRCRLRLGRVPIPPARSSRCVPAEAGPGGRGLRVVFEIPA
jgi:hypothetical protein